MELGKVATAGLAAENRGAATSVNEEVLALGNVLDVNLSTTVGFGEDTAELVSNRFEE